MNAVVYEKPYTVVVEEVRYAGGRAEFLRVPYADFNLLEGWTKVVLHA
jgi:hypothetical protein